jgi:hypothetical protein
VPAGLHTVTWRYAPASFAAGLALGGIGLALALAGLLAGIVVRQLH